MQGSDIFFLVNASGNVGVNSSYPTSTLHVVGDANITSNLYGGTVYSAGNEVCTASNGLCAGSVPYQSSAAGWTNTSTQTSTDKRVVITSASTDGSLVVGNSTTQHFMVSGSGGQVMIGGNNANGVLTVNGTGTLLNLTSTFVGFPAPVLTIDSGWRLRYGATGFGIGTSTEVINFGANDFFTNSASASFFTIQPQGSQAGPVFKVMRGTTTYLQVNATGNIGINTTNPTSHLHVVGDANITSNLYGGTVYSGGNEVCTASNGLCAGASGGNITGSGTANYLARWTNVTNIGIGATYDDGTNVAIGTATTAGKLRVLNGAVLFDGTTGTTPASGPGTRMMWIPAKAAFRAGQVSGTDWNDANIGGNSIAMGLDAFANASYTIALGTYVQATGSQSVVIGSGGFSDKAVASGANAIAIGDKNIAASSYATALGADNEIYSDYSTSLGISNRINGSLYNYVFGVGIISTGGSAFLAGITISNNASRVVLIGQNLNATETNTFIIGSGPTSSQRLTNNIANSMMFGVNSTVPTLWLNSSRVGILTTSPNYEFEVNGSANITSNLYGGTVYSGGNEVCTAANGLCASAAAGSGWINTSTQVYLSNNATNLSIGQISSNPVLFVDTTSGRVGIRNSAVDSNQGNPTLLIGNDGLTPNLGLFGTEDTDRTAIISFGSWSGGVSHEIYFRDSGTRGLVFNSSLTGAQLFLERSLGYIGINTTSPTSQLHVIGDANITRNVTGGGLRTLGDVGIGTLAPAAKLQVLGGDVYVSGSTNTRIVVGDTLAAGDFGQLQWDTTNDDLELGTDSTLDDLVLQPGGGEVGVGTNSPTHTLTVAGTFNVTGQQAIGANTTYTIPSGSGTVCFERFIGTTYNYTRCVNSTGNVIETVGSFVA
jgi:hypothetical protein